jgi:hypothetical protein
VTGGRGAPPAAVTTYVDLLREETRADLLDLCPRREHYTS